MGKALYRMGGKPKINISAQEAMAVRAQLRRMIDSAPDRLKPGLRQAATAFNREIAQKVPGFGQIINTRVQLQDIIDVLSKPGKSPFHVGWMGHVYGRTVPGAIGGAMGALAGGRMAGVPGAYAGAIGGAILGGGPGGMGVARGLTTQLPMRGVVGSLATAMSPGGGVRQPPTPEEQLRLDEQRKATRKKLESFPTE
jgi:hypothetical protein